MTQVLPVWKGSLAKRFYLRYLIPLKLVIWNGYLFGLGYFETILVILFLRMIILKNPSKLPQVE